MRCGAKMVHEPGPRANAWFTWWNALFHRIVLSHATHATIVPLHAEAERHRLPARHRDYRAAGAGACRVARLPFRSRAYAGAGVGESSGLFASAGAPACEERLVPLRRGRLGAGEGRRIDRRGVDRHGRYEMERHAALG